MARAKQGLEPNRPEQDERSPERRSGPMQRKQSHPSIWSSPFTLMNRFAEEMERMFEDFGFGRQRRSSRYGEEFGRGWGEMSQSLWSPQIEVFERGGKFIVRADLPGLKKDDVKVDITDDGIRIQGERRYESEDEREGWHHTERSYGSFLRIIPLPEGVDAQDAQANFRDGVLEITMAAPQRTEHRRQIEIQ